MFFAPRDPGFGHRTDPAAIGEGDGIGPCEGPERGEPMIGPLLELTEQERHNRRGTSGSDEFQVNLKLV